MAKAYSGRTTKTTSRVSNRLQTNLQDDDGRFMTVKFFDKTGRNEEDQIFRIENLAGY